MKVLNTKFSILKKVWNKEKQGIYNNLYANLDNKIVHCKKYGHKCSEDLEG